MRTVTATVAALAVAFALTGCIRLNDAPESEPTPTPTVHRVPVDWDAYPTSTQQIIDDYEAAADCGALQEMFDAADTAGFTDQMRYIDEAMKLAGCY